MVPLTNSSDVEYPPGEAPWWVPGPLTYAQVTAAEPLGMPPLTPYVKGLSGLLGGLMWYLPLQNAIFHKSSRARIQRSSRQLKCTTREAFYWVALGDMVDHHDRYSLYRPQEAFHVENCSLRLEKGEHPIETRVLRLLSSLHSKTCKKY